MFLATSVSPYMTATSGHSKSGPPRTNIQGPIVAPVGMMLEHPTEAYNSNTGGDIALKLSPNPSNQVFSGKFVKRR